MTLPGRAALHWLKHSLYIDAAETQTTSAEREALARHAAGKKRLVEIGVFEGVTSVVLGRSMSYDGVLFGVDPFLTGRLGICWSEGVAYRELQRNKPRGELRLVRRYSFDAVTEIDGDFDFLFIDGDHSLEGIRRDWADWSPRIQPAGIVALHDTQVPPHNPDVAQLGSFQYFESHMRHDPRFELVEQIHSLSVMKRR